MPDLYLTQAVTVDAITYPAPAVVNIDRGASASLIAAGAALHLSPHVLANSAAVPRFDHARLRERRFVSGRDGTGITTIPAACYAARVIMETLILAPVSVDGYEYARGAVVDFDAPTALDLLGQMLATTARDAIGQALGSGVTRVEHDRNLALRVTRIVALPAPTPTPTPTPTPPPPPMPTITKPTIVQTSASGASPFKWQVADDPSFQPGYLWHVQRATGGSVAAALGNLGAGTLNGEAIQEITPQDLATTGDIVFADLTATPSGPLALRVRVGADNGTGVIAWGTWSDPITDTIAVVASATLYTGAVGVNRSNYTSVSGNPALTVASTAAGNGQLSSARTTSSPAANTKVHIEATLNSVGDAYPKFNFGVSDASLDLSGYPTPGSGTNKGFSLQGYGTDSIRFFANGTSGVGNNGNDYAFAFVVGDVLVIEFDVVTGKVDAWAGHNSSGTWAWTKLGPQLTLASPPSSYTAQAGGNGLTDSLTINFGATAFAKAPSTGYSIYA